MDIYDFFNKRALRLGVCLGVEQAFRPDCQVWVESWSSCSLGPVVTVPRASRQDRRAVLVSHPIAGVEFEVDKSVLGLEDNFTHRGTSQEHPMIIDLKQGLFPGTPYE